MKLVIDIPKQDYELACKYPEALLGAYAKCIKNGTILPKGHGDLKDVERLKEVFRRNTGCVPYFEIEEAPTIIEADKGESE